MDSSVRDLLDGDLRDLLTAYNLLSKHFAAHAAEMDFNVAKDIGEGLDNIHEGIGQIACSECWGADRTPYRVGTISIDAFTSFCEPCAEKRSTTRDPFGGVTTFRSDE